MPLSISKNGIAGIIDFSITGNQTIGNTLSVTGVSTLNTTALGATSVTGNLTVSAGGIITAPNAQEFRLQAKDTDSVLRNEIKIISCINSRQSKMFLSYLLFNTIFYTLSVSVPSVSGL